MLDALQRIVGARRIEERERLCAIEALDAETIDDSVADLREARIGKPARELFGGHVFERSFAGGVEHEGVRDLSIADAHAELDAVIFDQVLQLLKQIAAIVRGAA